MRKVFLLLVTFIGFSIITNAQEKTRIAVMDFEAGVGINQSDVDGISNMLTTALFDTRRFTIVERNQINQAIKEQNFQSSSLSPGQISKIGQILGVKKVIIGNVNIVFQEYNIDVRIIDVESGIVESTAGKTIRQGSQFRENIAELANELVKKISNDVTNVKTNIQTNSKDGVLINGVLWATKNIEASSPEDLGEIYSWERAQSACPLGWRLPTKRELSDLINYGSTWGELKGVEGRFFGDEQQNLFFPVGFNMENGLAGGQYWCNLQNDYLMFTNKEVKMTNYSYSTGDKSVRCVKK